MPRPILTHDGFLIPNASRVSSPRMAEPDQIDFNTLAHARWGVIEGCLITCSASTATTLGGIAIVDGKLVTVAEGSVDLGIGGAQDRFDLLVVDAGGALLHIRGESAADPVYPDVPLDNTVLAAVYVPTGTSNLADNVVDKRKFVSKALLTKIPPGDALVQNKNGTGDHFIVSGGGTMTWENDTLLFRSGPKTLRIVENLTLDGALTAGGALTANSLTAIERVQGQNLYTSTTFPPTAPTGALFQHETTGRIYVRQAGAWKELATLESAVPVGTVITSVMPKATMVALGWVALDGTTVSEATYPTLFTIPNFGTVSGTAPNRTMVLPNAEGRVPMTKWAARPGTVGGNINNQVVLALAQMPYHKHDVAVSLSGGAPMSATISPAPDHIHGMVQGGSHVHNSQASDHVHEGMDNFGQPAPVIAVAWGGRNKIDALFNDRNHTYSVEKAQWTMPARAEVTVLAAGSAHAHVLQPDGGHGHVIAVSNTPNHIHPVTETAKGSGSPIDVTPQYLTMYTYVRS